MFRIYWNEVGASKVLWRPSGSRSVDSLTLDINPLERKPEYQWTLVKFNSITHSTSTNSVSVSIVFLFANYWIFKNFQSHPSSNKVTESELTAFILCFSTLETSQDINSEVHEFMCFFHLIYKKKSDWNLIIRLLFFFTLLLTNWDKKIG